MSKIKWLKPDGREIETNDHPANVAAATAAGWERADAPALDSRGLPHDERINTKNKSQNETGDWRYKQGVTAETAAPIEQELYAALVDGTE